jgi:hypothetical protein
MMKTSTTRICVFLALLTMCLTTAAYADSIKMTITATNSAGTVATISLFDTGTASGSYNADGSVFVQQYDSIGNPINTAAYTITEVAGLGEMFTGTLPGTDLYTTASVGFVTNPSNGGLPQQNTLTLDVTNAGCNSNCAGSQILITLSDDGATVPTPPTTALASATLFGNGASTINSSVTVKSTVVDTSSNTSYSVLNTNPGGAAPLSGSGSGTVNLTAAYSIVSQANITFSGNVGNAGNFQLETTVNGCTPGADGTCGGTPLLIGTPTNAPEPVSLLLVGSGLLGLGVLRRKYGRTL